MKIDLISTTAGFGYHHLGAITVNEFCELLGVGRTTANKLFQSGAVPSKKVGSRRIIPITGVIAWLNNQAEPK